MIFVIKAFHLEDIDEFIFQLPRNEQVILKRLRAIIMGCDPRIREQFSYGVPYYFRKRRICFIWPKSVPYGPKDALVSFGFCYANMLSKEHNGLLKEGRTQVAVIKYANLNEIDEQLINTILQEAILVDQLPFNKTKKPRR